MSDSQHQQIGVRPIQQLQRQLMARVSEALPQEAFSTDGRTFGYQAQMSLRIPVGCYVTLHAADDTRYLGQIIKKETVTREGPEIGMDLSPEQMAMLPEGMGAAHFTNRIRVRALEGTGVLLGKLAGDDIVPTTNTDMFQNAEVTLADPTVVSRYLALAGRSTSLPIGSALYVDGFAPTHLRASGFNRHTFLCGQSGSGKTFALGIILEQLLLNTNLRIVILDPNSDFVNLDQMVTLEQRNRFCAHPLSAKEYDQLATRYRTATSGVRILRPEGVADSPSADFARTLCRLGAPGTGHRLAVGSAGRPAGIQHLLENCGPVGRRLHAGRRAQRGRPQLYGGGAPDWPAH